MTSKASLMHSTTSSAMSTKLLIDADYFLYRAASHAEEELEFSSDLTFVVGSLKKGQRRFKNEINDLCEKFNSRDVILTFTSTNNFRKTVDPTYKGNRIKRKPAGYLRLKTWAMDTWKSVMKPGLEADDVCGILATNGSLGDDFVLISPDKDMLQIPCRLYNLKEDFVQNEADAERKLYEQCLTGDSTDGYSGCVGVGPKRADIILNKAEGNYWPAVLKAFKDADMTEEDALRNLRLARILQATDWDSESQTPILITP